MGSGRSRQKEISRETVLIETSKGDYEVDLDSELIDDTLFSYIDGSLSFSMTSKEVQDYVKSVGLTISFGWDLDEAGDIQFILNDDGSAIADIKSEDLRFAVYDVARTYANLQSIYEGATGSTEPIVSWVRFEALADPDNTRTSGVFSYAEESISISSSAPYLLSLNTARMVREKGLSYAFEHIDETEVNTFISEQSKRDNGWHPILAFTQSTFVHEYGHAIHNAMKSKDPTRFKTEIEKIFNRNFNSPVSEYAQTDSGEMFAECFALYCYGGKSESSMYKSFCTLMESSGLEEFYGCMR